jgi:uncharacterized protein
MSALLAPFRRSPSPLATLAVALAVGAVGTSLELAASGVPASAPRVLSLATAFLCACASLVIAASGLVWGSRAPLASHARVGIASALVLGWQVVDLLHFRLFARHVDAAALQLGWEAVRSRTLRVTPGDALAFFSALAMTAFFAAALHAILSAVTWSERVGLRLRVANGVVLLVGLAGGLLHDRLWDARHAEAARLATCLPWVPDPTALGGTSTDVGWGTDQDERTLGALASVRQRLRAAALSAETTPDLLVVHVESLRHDVLTRELMPRLSALGGECWVGPHHYSTGNNTGSSVFGLVTGLSGYFYPGARRSPAPALPLVVLRQLGYRTSVHFANNLSTYDGVFDVLFRGAVDETFTAPEASSDRMDVSVVEHYLSSLAGSKGPRFDYVVLDSTHYDYAYPPEFERHTPSATLGLGIRDGIVVEPGINDRMRPKAPLVRNRYLNSVEWVDTLIGKLIDGLRERGRWGKTWVVFVGDHGEAFWDHGTFGHGMGLEDEQVRVPFVLCDGASPGEIRYEYSSHADLMPTWLGRMRIRGLPGPFMSGRSLSRYRPETDLAVVGMGITGAFSSRRFVAAGHGLKVAFDNAPRWPLVAVFDDHDGALGAVPDAAYTLMAEALATKLLRSPSLD